MGDAPASHGPARSGATSPADERRARAAAGAALGGLRPVVTQSSDGLTLILLRSGQHAMPREASAGGSTADGEVRGIAAAFALPPAAVGVAVGVFDRIVSIDAFDDAPALAAAWTDLVARAVATWRLERDAIDAGALPRPGRRSPDEGATGRLLRRASVALDRAAISPGAASGAEVDMRISDERVEGSVRVSGDRVVRLALLPRESDDAPDRLVP